MKPLRDLLTHSAIYMIGQILTRLASVLLLPFYTNMLVPAEYGITGILDLTAAILGTLIAGGLVAAVTRHHFDGEDDAHVDSVWWTGLSTASLICAAICFPMWLFRHALADVTLGPEIADGAWFYTLTLATLSFTILGMILEAYLRTQKWSVLFVSFSISRLILNVALNVWLMAGLKMGVEGLLIGNLTATVLYAVGLFAVFVRTRGRYSFNRGIGNQMMRFALPMVVPAIATMLMHQADHFFLKLWGSLEEVGVYALAHKIGFAVHTLCLLPFLSIWHVSVYEIERMPDAKQIYGRIFGWFVSGLGILLLGASLTVHPILPLLTPDAYGDSIELIAGVLAGFFCFALSFMFEVPALLTKQTRRLIPGSVAGLIVNVSANALLIPIYGMWGAVWAGIFTYLTYSFLIFGFCRPVMKIDYPWLQSTTTVVALTATYLGVRFWCFPNLSQWQQVTVSVAVCAGWAMLLFGREGLNLLMERFGRSDAVPGSGNAIPTVSKNVPA